MNFESVYKLNSDDLISYPSADVGKRLLIGVVGECPLLVIGQNPNIANAFQSDGTCNTIDHLVRYSTEYNGWMLVNLYPERSGEPDLLPENGDPELLQENWELINLVLNLHPEISAVLLAWGDASDSRKYLKEMKTKLIKLFKDKGFKTLCVEQTAKGNPYSLSARSVNRYLGGKERLRLRKMSFD